MRISPQHNKKITKINKNEALVNTMGFYSPSWIKKTMLSLLSTKISLEHIFFRRAAFTKVSRWRF